MKCSICYKNTSRKKEYAFICDKLPKKIADEIYSFIENNPFSHINEIRMHSFSYLSFIADFKNVKTKLYLNEDDIEESVNMLCSGSIYAHFETIREGYISVGEGVRAGICGRAVSDDGGICGICDINSINIRIPQRIYHASDKVMEILENSDFSTSILIYSAPGVGKTTILRDLLCRISALDVAPRTCVIDTREEITPCIKEQINSDIFISYPKGKAIELATKSMTPQIIICDEISSMEEADSILYSLNCGVKFIATTHANDFKDLCDKEIMKKLICANVFQYAIGVKRDYGTKKYKYEINRLCDI